MIRRTRAVALFVALCAGAAHGVDVEPYVVAASIPDGVAILPPPPLAGSSAARNDRAVFSATRRLRGTARWQLATDDVSNAPLDRYACAMGLRLTPPEVPALARLLERVGTGLMVDAVKARYHTRRPFVGTRAPICEPKTDHLAGNPDYPSGHAANGWLEALILAELAPDRATAILARGRAYGESRVVCGSHSVSAVQGGWMAASVMFAALDAEPRFRRDLDAARQELAAIKEVAVHPDPARCEAERSVLAVRPW